MARFSDCLGREWTLRLTLGHRAAMKDIGVLLSPGDMGQTIAAFYEAMQDAEKVVALCHLLSTPTPTMTADEYAAGWDGETFERAGEALEECIADFFLSRRPKVKAAILAKVKAEREKADAKAAEVIARFGSGSS
jgi:hypothetical protein